VPTLHYERIPVLGTGFQCAIRLVAALLSVCRSEDAGQLDRNAGRLFVVTHELILRPFPVAAFADAVHGPYDSSGAIGVRSDADRKTGISASPLMRC
jgi:hypothetical protein